MVVSTHPLPPSSSVERKIFVARKKKKSKRPDVGFCLREGEREREREGESEMGSGGFDSDDEDSPVVIQGYKLNVGKKRLKQVRRASSLTPRKPKNIFASHIVYVFFVYYIILRYPLSHKIKLIRFTKTRSAPPRNAFAAL